jgi:hypothetical protein
MGDTPGNKTPAGAIAFLLTAPFVWAAKMGVEIATFLHVQKYPGIDGFMADTHLFIVWVIQRQTGGNNLRGLIKANF